MPRATSLSDLDAYGDAACEPTARAGVRAARAATRPRPGRASRSRGDGGHQLASRQRHRSSDAMSGAARAERCSRCRGEPRPGLAGGHEVVPGGDHGRPRPGDGRGDQGRGHRGSHRRPEPRRDGAVRAWLRPHRQWQRGRGHSDGRRASVAAVGGELEPDTAGGICCTTIGACTTIGDWTRAADWTDAQDRWCKREGIAGYPGMCRLYRSEIKEFRGRWLEAEAEAQQASVELAGFIPAAAGMALYRIGQIRLRRGDLAEAEEALGPGERARGARRAGAVAPAAAQGRVQVAADGIREAIERPPRTPSWHAPPGSALERMPLLRAQVEIALASGDVATARGALEQLESIADRFGSATMTATTTGARGLFQLRTGQAAEAARSLRDAVEAWTDLDAPYEAARARIGSRGDAGRGRTAGPRGDGAPRGPIRLRAARRGARASSRG